MENEEITLQCSLPLPCSEVVLVANEEKVKEEDNKQEEEGGQELNYKFE